jgi:hypothetical protein
LVKQILGWLGLAILVVALYKIFGGDFGLALTTIADWVINVVNAGSDIVIKIWNSINGQ